MVDTEPVREAPQPPGSSWRGGFGGARRLAVGLLPWLPIVTSGVFLVALAVFLPRMVDALAWNADFVSPMVIADSIGGLHRPGDLVTGTYGVYTTFAFNLVTQPLPGHRLVWQLGPFALSLLGVALLGWATHRVAGRWSAVAASAIAVSASPPVLSTYLAQANHGPTYFVVCLLAAFLVLVSVRPPSKAKVVTATIVVGVVTGTNLASDPLLLLVGVGPFFGAALVCAVRVPGAASRRALAVAGATSSLSAVVSVVTLKGMQALGFETLGASGDEPLGFATGPEIVGNVGRLATNLLKVTNSDFPGRMLNPESVASAVLAAPALVAIALPVVLLVRALRARPEPGDPALARALFVSFWGIVASGVIAAVVLSSLVVVNAPRSIAYLTPVFLAAAVAVPLAARTSLQRAAVGAGAGLFCLLSALPVVQQDLVRAIRQAPYVKDGNRLLDSLASKGLTRGYASYGNASPLTFKSDGKTQVRPVWYCQVAETLTLCGFVANRLSDWYTPEPGIRTFVIGDPTLPAAISVPPAAFGPPAETFTVGSQTVFVYPYDVASRFGPTSH